MELFASVLFPRALLLLAFAAWLAVAIVNNIRDRDTNVFLLGIMFRMTLLKEDPNMGNGLKHRAIDDRSFHRRALSVIVACQIVIAVALGFAGVAAAAEWLGWPLVDATGVANLALALFASLWVFFLTGGLWFGYWMKQPQVQQVHMTLVLMAIGMFVIVNLPVA